MNCHCDSSQPRHWAPRTEHELLQGRLLAEGVAAAIERAGARRVLVVSPRRGDGRTHVAGLLESMVAERVASDVNQRWCFLGLAETATLPPGRLCGECRVIVDGPALLEGDGRVGLPPGWMSTIDGVLIVLRAGRTTEGELTLLKARLDALGLRPVGVVWNERREPGPLALLGRLVGRLRGGQPAAPATASLPMARGVAAQEQHS